MHGNPSCRSNKSFNKGCWSATEDKILTDYVKAHGDGRWGKLPKRAGLNRCPRSCRLRWLNYLRPDIKRGNISHEEEDLIIRLHNLLGNRWSLIAGRLPGRTDNEIKNYWNTVLRKKVKACSVGSMKTMHSDKDEDGSSFKSQEKVKCPESENSTSWAGASVSSQHDDKNICKKESKKTVVSGEPHLDTTYFLGPEDCDHPVMAEESCTKQHPLDIDFSEFFGHNLQKDMRIWGIVDAPLSPDDDLMFFSNRVSDTWFDGDDIQLCGGINLESFFPSESEFLGL
ncbi:hypothetical protein OPV22_021205 [Ensete ventricosum]|uniref:Transcription factor MYB1 n=1 Tax=Ensete ventricosum TaxID=4639 RepID=A0AAV8QRQ2_ENSVE|nr:hypothetical protein OPV22_021205 [Ensete ventricosum]